ncbi:MULTISPECIES: hypothetical protein [Bradyrhizobium]|uniref:hypothetical protein n=1 Tax=Bradyrhizobium TaxID=374 RepID=UPI001BA9F27D|nr:MULTISPECIES: hypothetical protein [Bradyrhizobium]MBR1033797.1 hypothetical protein [Bradyrhizobium liaoningense]MCP1774905.1 hypothetical protein [Bradyrhizobium japonicum]MCP1962095.1 hypothetical protein [Bradyrhizobium japonicum]
MSLTRTELTRIQKVYVRLLYSRQVLKEYEQDPLNFAAQWQLPTSSLNLLPDTRSPGYRAELFGRRIQAVQELRPHYRPTFAVLMGGETSEREIAEANWFTAFLDSEYFFDAGLSLPHPTGIGRGHEGVTRFFFWARDHFSLQGDSADPKLRLEVFTDFASLVDSLAHNAIDARFRELDHGLFWLMHPSDSRKAFALAPDRRILTVSGSDVVASLSALGMADLDALEP